MWDYASDAGGLAVLDVATGEVEDRIDIRSPDDCAIGAVSDPDPASTTDGPVVVTWSAAAAGCGAPTLLRYDAQGRDHGAGIRDPDHPHAPPRVLACTGCQGRRVLARGDVVAVELENGLNESADFVALSAQGDLLWRASDRIDATPVSDDRTPIITGSAVTDRHVVAGTRGRWHLLSLVDGTEVAARPSCAGPDTIAAGTPDAQAERLYARCDDGLAVIDLADLEDISRGGPTVRWWNDAFAADDHLVALTWSDFGIPTITSLTS